MIVHNSCKFPTTVRIFPKILHLSVTFVSKIRIVGTASLYKKDIILKVNMGTNVWYN